MPSSSCRLYILPIGSVVLVGADPFHVRSSLFVCFSLRSMHGVKDSDRED